jgi:hypothetical protein
MVGIFLELIEYLLKDALRIPPRKPAVDGFPRPEAVRQISPGRACFSHVEDGIHESAIC